MCGVPLYVIAWSLIWVHCVDYLFNSYGLFVPSFFDITHAVCLLSSSSKIAKSFRKAGVDEALVKVGAKKKPKAKGKGKRKGGEDAGDTEAQESGALSDEDDEKKGTPATGMLGE